MGTKFDVSTWLLRKKTCECDAYGGSGAVQQERERERMVVCRDVWVIGEAVMQADLGAVVIKIWTVYASSCPVGECRVISNLAREEYL